MIRLKTLRKSHNLTQQDVANAIEMTRSGYANIENSHRDPDTSTLKRLADFYGVSIDYLLGYSSSVSTPKKGVKIKILGEIAAGIPIDAIEDVIDEEEIDEELAKTGEFFGLRIKGQSMEPRIWEGDTVIIRCQNDVESGDIACVIVDGETATCKKVLKHEDGITLVAMNPVVYPPHFYTNKEIQTLPVRVIGKVVEVRGKL